MDREMRGMTGGLKLVKVTKDDGSHLEAILAEGNGRYSEFVIDVTATNPPTIRGMGLRPADPPAGGGTGDVFTPEYEARRLETRTLADDVTLFGGRPLRFDPGSRFEYSNYGFILLGRLIEIVSGENYYAYLQKQVFAPAGMTRTDSRPEVEAVPGRATGYVRGEGGPTTNKAGMPWRGTSAGGGYSTVGDLLRFANALRSGALVDAALLKEAVTDKAGRRYGLGFYARPDGSFGHGGGAPGINGELSVFPSGLFPTSGYVVAVLANQDPPAATVVKDFIGARLPQQP
jgi:CubicO group peptidase (beta-lactamase class C family)